MPTPELIVFAWILSECQALIRIPRKFIDLAAKHINVKVLDPRVGDCLRQLGLDMRFAISVSRFGTPSAPSENYPVKGIGFKLLVHKKKIY